VLLRPVRRSPLPARAVTVVVAAAVAFVAVGYSTDAPVARATSRVVSGAQPAVKHVFVVNLENKGFNQTFRTSRAPYLSQRLTGKGMLLTHYYGIAHHSLPNYLAQISGQAPNPSTQADCQRFSAFKATGTVAPQQAKGRGCVYPKSVNTVATQLTRHGLSWRGYMQDMGTGCRHPALGARDTTQRAHKGDQYAARHNPFVYFKVITSKASCATHDVSLKHLSTDLSKVSTTRNLSYITPNLCNDGHDSPCVDGRKGGLTSANVWLKSWIPKILASPAFKRNGLLVVTFDEAETGDSRACCGEGAAPNTANPGITGKGGGRIGAVLVSPYISPGTKNKTTDYNHYSLLRTIEDIFGLPALGYAKRAQAFGSDVWR